MRAGDVNVAPDWHVEQGRGSCAGREGPWCPAMVHCGPGVRGLPGLVGGIWGRECSVRVRWLAT